MLTAENLAGTGGSASTESPISVPRPAAPERDLVRARVLGESTIMVSAFGEVDAATAPALADEIQRHLGGYRQLVLDFSRLDFFGTAGHSMLHRLHTRCLRTGVDWVLVPGPEVNRVLRVCDPEGDLPTASNIVSAVALLTRLPHRTPYLRATGTS